MTGAILALSAHHTGHAAAPWAYHPHLGAWLVIGLVGLLYAVGVRRVARSAGPGALPSRRQLLCLAGGLAALAVALTWPVADLAAHWSLTALVVQRLLLTLVAAPLLLLAVPEPAMAALTRPAPVDAAVEFLTRPPVAVVVFTVIAVGTLLPPAVAAQASSPLWRAAVDGALLFAGAVLWGPTLRHIPGAHRTAAIALAAYLFVQSVVPTFPAIVYVFAHHPLYPAFSRARRAVWMTPLVDQQLAGVVAKVATLPVLWTAAWAALARGQRADMAAHDDEPLTWAQVERQLERVARAERRGTSGRLRRRHRPTAAPIGESYTDPADSPEPRHVDGPGSNA